MLCVYKHSWRLAIHPSMNIHPHPDLGCSGFYWHLRRIFTLFLRNNKKNWIFPPQVLSPGHGLLQHAAQHSLALSGHIPAIQCKGFLYKVKNHPFPWTPQVYYWMCWFFFQLIIVVTVEFSCLKGIRSISPESVTMLPTESLIQTLQSSTCYSSTPIFPPERHKVVGQSGREAQQRHLSSTVLPTDAHWCWGCARWKAAARNSIQVSQLNSRDSTSWAITTASGVCLKKKLEPGTGPRLSDMVTGILKARQTLILNLNLQKPWRLTEGQHTVYPQ